MPAIVPCGEVKRYIASDRPSSDIDLIVELVQNDVWTFP